MVSLPCHWLLSHYTKVYTWNENRICCYWLISYKDDQFSTLQHYSTVFLYTQPLVNDCWPVSLDTVGDDSDVLSVSMSQLKSFILFEFEWKD